MALKESEAIVLRTYPMREAIFWLRFLRGWKGKFAGGAVGEEVAATVWWGTGALTFVRAVYEDRERQN